jgi:hypothetical protein
MSGKENIMKINIIRNHRGAVLIIFAILLLVFIGFVALAIDVGRWYTVRSELSKSVDAAAIAGAKNISNPFLGTDGNLRLAEEIGRQNFSSGYLMTTDTPTFTATTLEDHRIQVTGAVNSPGNLAALFGVDQVPTSASGIARKNEVEIMLVLDRSGSMLGTKMRDLKTAALSFISYFEETQDQDKMGLISFATTASVDVNLGNNYVSSMNNHINAMNANGATNAEDALARTLGAGGLTDQTGVPGESRVQQFVIFFSDGMPTALRDQFKYNNADYDGVVYGQGSSGHANCRTADYSYMSVVSGLQKPNSSTTGDFFSGVNPQTTGDGKRTSGSPLTSCRESSYPYSRYLNTKWYLFEASRLGPVPGYTAEQCSIPMNRLLPYFCSAARQLALSNAQTIKDRFIKIYVIGLGANQDIDAAYLRSLSSGDSFTYITPTSGELLAIFNSIAKDIKLRLVQ